MTALASATRLHSTGDELVAECVACGQTLQQLDGFDRDVALGLLFHHHPSSPDALHRPEVPRGWRTAADR